MRVQLHPIDRRLQETKNIKRRCSLRIDPKADQVTSKYGSCVQSPMYVALSGSGTATRNQNVPFVKLIFGKLQCRRNECGRTASQSSTFVNIGNSDEANASTFCKC